MPRKVIGLVLMVVLAAAPQLPGLEMSATAAAGENAPANGMEEGTAEESDTGADRGPGAEGQPGEAGEEGFLGPYQEPDEPEGASPWQLVMRVVLSLGLVVGLFYILARFLKSRSGLVNSRHMEVADRLSLGANRELYIVRLGDQFLVLGVTGEQVALLGEVDDPALQVELRQEMEQQGSFAEALSLQRSAPTSSRGLNLSALEEQLNRLRSGRGRGQSGGERRN